MPSSFFFRAVLYFLLFLFTAAPAETPARRRNEPLPTQIPGQNAILMGVAWYPEQWPESRWEEDLRLMEAANLKVVRIAEFCLEPHGALRGTL